MNRVLQGRRQLLMEVRRLGSYRGYDINNFVFGHREQLRFGSLLSVMEGGGSTPLSVTWEYVEILSRLFLGHIFLIVFHIGILSYLS